MASPEARGGDLILVDNSRVGRALARAMYSDGKIVYARMIAAWKPGQAPQHEPRFLCVPVDYPGLRTIARAFKPSQGELPNF